MGAGVSAAQADEVTLRVSRAEAVAVLALLGEPRLREELAQLGKDRSGDALDLAQRLLATKELNVDEDDDDAIAQQLASTERLLTLDQASATAQSPGKRVTIDPAPSPVSAGPPSPSHFDAAAVGEAANMHGGDGEAVESLTTEQKADFEKYGVLEAKVDSYWTLADKVEILAEFKALDLDNDGLVTVTEYRTHLRSKGGVERDEAEVDAIIQRMKQYIREDPDADGRIRRRTLGTKGNLGRRMSGVGLYARAVGPWGADPIAGTLCWDQLSDPLVGRGSLSARGRDRRPLRWTVGPLVELRPYLGRRPPAPGPAVSPWYRLSGGASPGAQTVGPSGGLTFSALVLRPRLSGPMLELRPWDADHGSLCRGRTVCMLVPDRRPH